MTDKTEILDALRKAVQLYSELGFEYIPVKKEVIDSALASGIGTAQQTVIQKGGRRREKTVKGADNGVDSLRSLREEIGDCRRCRLYRGRTNIVFGEGSSTADLMFIGEGPGRDEDIQARPFVGEAGKLLTSLIVKLGLRREDVYIANIVKCRPPNNRNPEDDEITTCLPFVEKQVGLIQPRVIVCLGRISAQALLRTKAAIGKIRGNFFDFNGIPVMPTFHPAYLLRNPKDKWLTWDDMQKVLEKLKVR